MAAPKVFVSSTCYDLRYIRENLKYFIKSLGYDPILSEEGSVFYDPKLHVQDACIAELPNCQMLILIIGGRFGSPFKATSKSVTNAEYSEAARLKIPIFALVEQGVHSDLNVYASNRSDRHLVAKMKFPSVDNTAIFDFAEEVRSNAVNNALVPFRDFADIESYLRQQWAGMMFSFLAGANQSARVADTLSVMQEMSERIEMLSRQILNSVGTEQAKMTAALYEAMLSHGVTKTLQDWGFSITPIAVLQNETIVKCAKALGKKLKVLSDQASFDEESILSDRSVVQSARVELATQNPIEHHGREHPKFRIQSTITKGGDVYVDDRYLDGLSKDYARMRKEFQQILNRFNITVEQYLAAETTVSEVRSSRKRSSRSG